MENWKKFLLESPVKRPPYKLPISRRALLAKIEQFILDTSPAPKGSAKTLKNKLQQGGRVCHESFGLCFDAATLMLHMSGGKHYSGLTKKSSPKGPLGPDVEGESTHWWLEDEEGAILDPTAGQFTFGADPPYGRKKKGWSDIGFPYFKRGGTNYSELVPPRKVIEFAKAFKLWHKQKHGKDTAYGMDWWLEEKLK